MTKRMTTLFDSIPKKVKPKRPEQVPIQIYMPKKLHDEMKEILKEKNMTWATFVRSIVQRARDESMQRLK
jgi:hypothetical protein